MVITGGVFSTTDTIAVQVASPAVFSALMVTVTGPVPTRLPATGDWVMVTEQPVATTSPTRLGMTPSHAFALTVLFVAHVVIVGALAGITVTVKSQ